MACAEAPASTADPWEVEKQTHATRLYTALVALVGDVETLRLTSASLSWRSAAGVQGHWREENGQFWLGRIVWTPEGRQSTQLMLALAPRAEVPGQAHGQAEDRPRLAHPLVHHARSAEGPVVSCDPDTRQIYEAAQWLLIQLGTELRTMLTHLSPEQEAAP